MPQRLLTPAILGALALLMAGLALRERGRTGRWTPAARIRMRVAAIFAAVVALLLVLLVPGPAQAAPRACQPTPEQAERLRAARLAYRPDDPAEATRLWDEVLAGAAGGPPCRTVEIAWQIGDLLKRDRESADLALRYLNRGMAAATRNGRVDEDLPLAKVLKSSGQVFRRQGDAARACRSLQGAWRIFEAAGAMGAPALAQTTEDLAETGCPVPAPGPAGAALSGTTSP